ncbi:MAG: hypothetical protein R3D05_05690 [Dongiaceae bacterium]
MFLKTIAEQDATGKVAEIYRHEKAKAGFLMNADQSWTARPDLLPLFIPFFEGVKAGFSLSVRDWRLITLIAAKQVPSTYCSYVYGKLLVGDLGSKEAVMRLHRDFRTAGLPERDVEMLAYAEQVARDASKITQADIDRLRSVGFTDQQICDIALCAALRCFFSRFIDAVGAMPDEAFIDSDEEFRTAMTVGKQV